MIIKNKKPVGKAALSPSIRIGIVVSLFNRELTEPLEQKCVETLRAAGVSPDHIEIFTTPGAFEIPLKCQQLAQTKDYSVIITLGVVIKGGTHHFKLVANECARGVMEVMLKHNIPIVFEVLAGEKDDMIKRAGNDEYNKGIAAAHAALQLM